MLLKVILILSFILAITIGAHVLLYKAIANFFVITHTRVKVALFVCLLFLALSFMASFFLLRWQENGFTVGFYMFSATWTGSFINLLLAAGVSWLLIAIFRITGHNPNTRLIAASWFILAVLYSTYGVWNAFQPRIKTIHVKIKNLPEHWKNKTIVQLSDVHLGHIYGERFLNNLIKKVNATNPEIVFITGDLFDGMVSDLMHFARPLKLLKAPKGVFFITGNHEIYVGLNRALNVLNQTKIKILHNEVIETDGLQIIGISYPGIKKVNEINGFETLKQNPSHKVPRILLFHTPTNIRPKGKDELDQHFTTYWVPDTNFGFHKQLGVNLQISGHSHAGQIFPFGFLTKLIYKGHDYGLRREGGFYIYTTSGVGTWGPPMRTGNSPEIVAITLK
ncbi:MAG: metallophosphoesterase [Desulfobacterales bacterium]|nr:MAG: metallophosphoesterase [Desulfobacterales bacterium]